MTAPPRIPAGPQLLCRQCGAIANHISGLCRACRPSEPSDTRADRDYLAWLRARDAERGT